MNTKGYASNPELARESAYKSHESWNKNGKKPRGFAANPELARQAGIKSSRKARENGIKAKQEKA